MAVDKGLEIEGLSTSILETPTYILTIVLVFFLVLTLGFENLIHYTKHFLRKKGRAGLADALEKVVLELTLLGFVSLILLVFKDYVPSICVKYQPEQVKWTLLDSAQGCPCCLSETAGLTYCAQIYHNCSFDSATKEPYCGCDLGWEESTYDPAIAAGTNCTSFKANEEKFVYNTFAGALSTGSNTSDLCALYSNLYGDGEISNTTNRGEGAPSPLPKVEGGARRLFLQEESTSGGKNSTELETESEGGTHVIPQIGTFGCDGPFYSGACENGQHPAISDTALEQTHLMLFLVALIHVFLSVLVVLLAMIRMRQWRRWQRIDIKKLKAEQQTIGEGEVPPSSTLEMKENGTGDAADVENGDTLLHGKSAVVPIEDQNSTEKSGSSTGKKFLAKAVSVAKGIGRTWQRRESHLTRPHQYFLEGLICFIKAFFRNFIKQKDFSIMRTAYITSRNLPYDFDFVKEVTIHLDYDLSRIVGASVSMWIILVLEKLLESIVGWISSFFILLAAVVLLSIDIGLVASIRYATRGGKPQRVKTALRWYQGAHWLAIPLGGLIFLCSLAYSNAVFYVWQFGPNSCYFDPPKGMQWGSILGGAPWWTHMIAPGVMLSWIANVTVPTWAMVMHMRPRGGVSMDGAEAEVAVSSVSEEKSGEIVEMKETEGETGVEKYTSQAEVVAEINKLQALLSKWQD